jgi:hypothetical protein
VCPADAQLSRRDLLDLKESVSGSAVAMTSPLSFGDIYLIGTLAWQLGRAFTKGRKSAPAEFREVENQLYSLSAALCALGRAHAEGSVSISMESPQLRATSLPDQADRDTIGTVLRSCEESLKHLERIVEKYSCIGKPRDHNQPMLKRWSRDLRANWRKIVWTSEGGDLATLRSQLTVHTNSLNLVLGVAIKYGLPVQSSVTSCPVAKAEFNGEQFTSKPAREPCGTGLDYVERDPRMVRAQLERDRVEHTGGGCQNTGSGLPVFGPQI